jgi:polysaccharide export outer membrane protein
VQAQQQARPREVPREVRQLFAAPRPYTIGPSDVISIVVYDHPELLPSAGAVISQQIDPTGISAAPGFIVGADGQVSFPFVGRIRVEGLTEIEASDLFQQRLARFIKNPQVTVRINSFRSRRAYVDGEVRTPGTQIFTDVPMTLPEAINRAGGITAAGDRSSVLLTRNNQSTLIDLMQLQELGVNPNQILLQSGDLVTVRSRDDTRVFVMGEISRPSALPMRNGRLSLNEALGETGGPNLATANTSQIYVIRNTAQVGAPAVFHLNAAAPTALALAETFPLQARDVVYIDPVPLVNWNRIVSLIIPSAQTLSATRSAISP